MSRLVLLGSLVYLLILAGLATLTRGLLVLAVPPLVYLVAAMLYGGREVRLTARRSVDPDRVSVDSPVRVCVALTNEGSSLEQVLIRDPIPPALEVIEGRGQMVTSLAEGETVELRYAVKPRRARVEFAELEVVTGELLGLWQRRVLVPAPARLWARPQPQRLRRLLIRPLRTRAIAGPVPARQGGPGVDFFSVREYQPGDPQRWINWRISARHPAALFTNEYEQERIADVGLILDARRRSDLAVQGDRLFEHSVRATATLGEAFLRYGNRVGLLVYGQFLDWTFPGYGKVQRERILQALARADTGESQVFQHLGNLPTRFFPAQSQIVLVSPVCREDPPMLVRLRARGYQVLVIRPDPVAFELKGSMDDAAMRLASRILHAEWVVMRSRLLEAGVQVVDWAVDRPLEQAIHGSLGRVPRWFRTVKAEVSGEDWILA